MISSGGLDSYLIQIITEGEISGDFSGVVSKASPGDILIIDLGRVVQSNVNPGHRITVVVPRQDLDKAVHWKNIHGLVLPGQAASSRLIAGFMRGILEVGPELTDEEADYAKNALIFLLSSAVNGTEVSDISDTVIHSNGIKSSIVSFIEKNIQNRELNVSYIQSHFNISRAHLYRLFDSENGISKYIKDKRLDYVLRVMAENRYRGVTAKQMAHESGFESPTALNRMFRERFGVTPKEMVKSGGHLKLSKFNADARSDVREQILDAAKLFLDIKESGDR
ncbi:AraC-like DNA-binding protein [Ochrobactrum daejeonense]|uniref:AraC-like DNA-binding protein n=1 Tax=Brucella daejeonensis TaxID=659015 RepID=A0A7W9AUE2_9HYPH|nr:AraC-like DNA-binding protein [Brucella daejeonensis]